jgi:methyltransferase (TIGR00027 family)
MIPPMESARDASAPRLGDVAETLLIPLFCRAQETRSQDPILRDPKAVEILEGLRPELEASERPLLRTIARGAMPKKLVVTMALRAARFDRYAREFLERAPGAVVVSLGCGLDTRFDRVDDGRVAWFDLDLPEVVELRRRFFNEAERYHMVASSVTEQGWMDAIVAAAAGRRVLFLAEGLFMYLPGDEVRALVVSLARRFPGSELVAEVFSAKWLPFVSSRWGRYKFQRQIHMAPGATFVSGLADSDEPERWADGIELLDDWTYFDDKHPKLGWMNLFGRTKWRKIQWTVHYRLGGATAVAGA